MFLGGLDVRRIGAWCRVVIAGSLLVAAGCASAPRGPATAELPPVRLRHASGARERCGVELIREVQRLNDLTWVERLFYSRSANREAGEAVKNEHEWRRQCTERYQRQGYEVVTAPSPR